jgi:glycosyltransferase involved in cell wall biosynthesis
MPLFHKFAEMKVSIIIPVYNVASSIERCMDSVLCQTYPNIECILVDDCSPDDSAERIARKINTYRGGIAFKFIRHEQNKGLSGARNTGIEAATGDYLYFLDSDDEITDNCIEILAHLAYNHNHVDIVQGSSYVIEGQNFIPRYQLKKSLPEFSRDSAWLRKKLLERKDIPVTAWNKLINRHFLRSNKLCFREGIIHEDEHWTFFASKSIRSMAFCKTPTYRHYIHEGSIMTSGASDRSIRDWLTIIGDFMNHIDKDQARNQRKMILEVSFCNLVRMIRKSPGDSLIELLRKQSDMLKPLWKSALKRGQLFELVLLSYFHLPVFMLRFLCRDTIKGLYFHILEYLV